MLTGESVLVHKTRGDTVTGGTLNGADSFLMQVSRIGADTVLAQIIERVREAQASEPAIVRLTDRVASVLKVQGLTVIILTEDRREVAQHIVADVGIEIVHAGVLPEQKLAVIESLQQQGHRVAMVGDGVNDAPALARADVGFAIGAGTDVAMAAADVTLVGGSLAGIDKAIRISRATTRNIWQNLFGAFVYNTFGIPVAAGVLYPFTGLLLNPMMAGAAMALSSVTVVTNANRLGRLKL